MDAATVTEPGDEPADDSDPTSTTSTALPTDNGDDGNSTSRSTIPPDVDTGGGSSGGTNPDQTTTSTTSSVPPITTNPPATPPSVLTLGARAIGTLVPDRTGVVTAIVSNSATSTRVAVVTVQVTMATITAGNDPSCVRSTLTVTCTVDVGPGASIDMPVTVVVEDDAPTVGVTVSASIAGIDPAPVTVTLATSSTGMAARLALTGQIDATVIGNTLASCADGAGIGATTCEAVRAGTAVSALANDDWTMTAVVEDLRGLGSSSSAALADIDPDTVVSALLIWAASTTSTTPPGASSVRFATPVTTGGAPPGLSSDYSLIIADDTVSTSGGWQSVADVTDLVDAAGSGDYWVADIVSDLGGPDAWAGWVLVIVHQSDGPVRDVVMFDGLEPLIPVATALGLPTTAAPVTVDVAVVTWDGDRSATGEDFQLTHAGGSVAITNAVSPSDDVANSSISVAGTAVTTGAPSYVNTLGVDIDRFDLGGRRRHPPRDGR